MGSRPTNNNSASYDSTAGIKGGDGTRTRARGRRGGKRAPGQSGQHAIETDITVKAVEHVSEPRRGPRRRPKSNPTTVPTALRRAAAAGPFRSPSDRGSKALAARVASIVRAFVDPQSHAGFLYPDADHAVVPYQAKQVVRLFGAAPQPLIVAPEDVGRFVHTINPILNDNITFASVAPSFQLATIDVGTAPTLTPFPAFYTSTAANNRCTYTADPEVTTFVVPGGLGLADRARCVGACTLISFDGDILTGGGDIAANCVPGDFWFKRLQNQTGPTGNNCVDFENMSNYPDTYTGALKTGAYLWWRPDDIKDMFLRSTQLNSASPGETMGTYCYPMLHVAGRINQSATAAVNSVLATSYINFNYTRNRRVVVGEDAMDDPEAIFWAMQYLRGIPTCVPNDAHIDWIKVVLGGVTGFILGGGIPGAAFGVAAGLGLSLSGIAGGRFTR